MRFARSWPGKTTNGRTLPRKAKGRHSVCLAAGLAVESGAAVQTSSWELERGVHTGTGLTASAFGAVVLGIGEAPEAADCGGGAGHSVHLFRLYRLL